MGQARVIANYETVANSGSQEEWDKEREKAREYNNSLLGRAELVDPFTSSDKKKDDLEYYNSIMNTNGEGVMGVVRVPEIGVRLPIYHDCETETLEKGAGHLPQTSFPIGDIGTHAVISAHTGSPRAEFFDNLTKVKENDIFYVDVLGETLAYRVDQIKVVLPEEINDLRINKDKDQVTLVTCTPYGVNSHRLLVRGIRTEYNPDEDQMNSDFLLSNGKYFWLAVCCLSLLFIGIILLIRLYRKRKLNGTA